MSEEKNVEERKRKQLFKVSIDTEETLRVDSVIGFKQADPVRAITINIEFPGAYAKSLDKNVSTAGFFYSNFIDAQADEPLEGVKTIMELSSHGNNIYSFQLELNNEGLKNLDGDELEKDYIKKLDFILNKAQVETEENIDKVDTAIKTNGNGNGYSKLASKHVINRSGEVSDLPTMTPNPKTGAGMIGFQTSARANIPEIE